MSYRSAVDALSVASEAEVVTIHAAYTDGRIGRDEAVARIAARVAAANMRAVSLADQSVAVTLMQKLGVPVPVLGLSYPPDTERLTTAATTLLTVVEDTADPVGRVARFGRVEPLDTATRAFGDALDEWEVVVGWRRGLSATACELCRWLEKDGYVYPTNRKMHHHKGCRCEQIIITDKDLEAEKR